MCDENTSLFPNLKDYTIEDCEWWIPHFSWHVILIHAEIKKLNHVIKGPLVMYCKYTYKLSAITFRVRELALTYIYIYI